LARQIISDLRPYKGGADAFYQIHKLDIIDKHRALIPVGINRGHIGVKVEPIKIPMARNPEHHQTIHFSPVPISSWRSSRPLKDGDVIFMKPASYTSTLIMKGPTGETRFNLPIPQDPNFEFTFEIAFGKDQVVDGEPVIPTLKQFIDFTEGAISIISKRFLGV